MMMEDTPFGKLRLPSNLSAPRRKAIIRALNWCVSIIASGSLWNVLDETTIGHGKGISRKIGKKRLTVYPLIAAKLDAGIEDNHLGIDLNHLPVEVNGRSVCVVPMNRSSSLLHTDMVASMLQLFCVEKPPKSAIPVTLGRRLYQEDFPPHSNIQGMYVNEHLNEFFDTLRQRAALFGDAVDYVLNELEQEDWVMVRERFPWNEHPDLALHIAAALMTPERSENDWQWLLDMYQRYEHEEYTTIILPELFWHFHPGVVLRAIREHQYASSNEAWTHLVPLLYHDDEEVQLAAHRLLTTFGELEEQLINTSLDLIAEILNSSEFSPNDCYLVAWLSHKVDMVEQLEHIITHLDPHRLSSFLESANFQGDWFLPYAEHWVKQPFRGVHASLVQCTSRNLTVDHYKLWMPMMKNGKGTLQSLILENLGVMDDERAHEFLDLGWKSHLRFIVRRTHETIETSYPNYPQMEQMYLHGYKHSPSPRIIRHCFEKLADQFPDSEIFRVEG